mmetsp:Transcript_25328/g.29831  ORF Transcript_25328/g.29831 Transcript_25328/m.29831 type:complete len:179 (+) Transcript_25328:1555-2091(+)
MVCMHWRAVWYRPPVIEPYEIIPIINAAWDKSFGRVSTNKKAIAERGWWPYNRNLLLHTKIRATMTDDEKSKEFDRNIIFPTHRNLHYVDLTKKTSTFDPSYIRTVTPEATKKLKLNFSKGTALRCLDTIVQSNDIMEARNRIRSFLTTFVSRRRRRTKRPVSQWKRQQHIVRRAGGS